MRAAGVSFEDQQDLLGHRRPITMSCSAAELANLIELQIACLKAVPAKCSHS
jgi:hypothetical protein